MSTVLLVEDDPLVQRALQLALSKHGHALITADSGEEGLDLLRLNPLDLVVLDLMLPGIDGFEVCRRIRACSSVPIIMLTARGDDGDVVAGLQAGADDYAVKPVRPEVLDARIRAVLRRADSSDQNERHFGELRIDPASLEVTLAGSVVSLTPTERRLLLTMSDAPGQVFSRQQLLELVWDYSYLGDSRLVDNVVQRLRTKIETEPTRPRYVQTVRGFGYRFGPV